MYSLRLQLTLGSIILAVCAIGLIAWDAFNAWKDLKHAHDMQQGAQIYAAISQGVVVMSLERSLVQVNGGLAEPIAPRFRSLLDEQRHIADAHLDRATNLLLAGSHTQPVMSSAAESLAAARREVAALRTRADAELAKPQDARDASFFAAWPRVFPAALEEMEILRLRLRDPNGRMSGMLSTLTDVSHFAWRIREYGGRERTYYALASARTSRLDATELTNVGALSARVETSWRTLEVLAQTEGLPQALHDGLRELDRLYFQGEYARLRAAYQRGEVPMEFDRIFQISETALNAAAATADLAAQLVLDYWQGEVQRSTTQLITQLILFAILLLTAVALLWVVMVRVAGRISGLEALMRQLASGQHNIELTPYHGRDEIGHMADAVEVFRNNAQALHEIVDQVQQSADAVTRSALRLNKMATELANASRGEKDSTLAVASAMDELSASITSVSERAGQASEVAKDSRHAADEGVRVIDAVVESIRCIEQAVQAAASNMEALKAESAQIGSVVGVISDIAAQTNLLALNAAIEAARAGEQGRGFAVVANEVRDLAEKTRQSTVEITNTIGLMQDRTNQVVERMNHSVELVSNGSEQAKLVNEVVERIESGSTEAGGLIEAISATLHEQQSTSSDVASNVEQIARMTEDTYTTATQTQSLAEELSALAEQLNGLLLRFKSG